MLIYIFVACNRDRPWQAYPITIVTGAYIGYAIGCAAGRTPLLYGKRIQFSKSEAVEREIQDVQTQTGAGEGNNDSALATKVAQYGELL